MTTTTKKALLDVSLADTLFTQLGLALARDPSLAGGVRGIYEIRVLRQGQRRATWYLVLPGNGSSTLPVVSRDAPDLFSVYGGVSQGLRAGGNNNTTTWISQHSAEGGGSNGGGGGLCIIDIEQRDLMNFFAGGLNTYKAIGSGKIRVVGDLGAAMQLEELFRKAGGVERTLEYMRTHAASQKQSIKAKL
ncbi:hypothetical protein BC828DRAFT_393075 [Blastocladiella britannica]|nr:hypothetical protein BC828DRAFT_393075 [Blastocladiella britannica]